VLRNRDVYPGSRILNFLSRIPDLKKIPDPEAGSSSKNLSTFNPKNCFLALGNMIRDVIPDPDLDFLSIKDPGSRGQKGTGSRIRNTDSKGLVQKIILLNRQTATLRVA
jgi:hypothetical protein